MAFTEGRIQPGGGVGGGLGCMRPPMNFCLGKGFASGLAGSTAPAVGSTAPAVGSSGVKPAASVSNWAADS